MLEDSSKHGWKICIIGQHTLSKAQLVFLWLDRTLKVLQRQDRHYTIHYNTVDKIVLYLLTLELFSVLQCMAVAYAIATHINFL